MAGMDGHALLRALRGIPHLQSIPSVALSGYGHEPLNDQGEEKEF